MNHSNIKRLYRVSAADYPIEQHLHSETAREAAEEYAALFDLGELFDEIVVTVSLCGPQGDHSVQRFRVDSAQLRVYEAARLEEPGFFETCELDDISDAEPLEWADLELIADDADGDEDETVLLLMPTSRRDEGSLEPIEAEPSECESSGLRRLVGIASRGYGTLVRGLFGKGRTSNEAA